MHYQPAGLDPVGEVFSFAALHCTCFDALRPSYVIGDVGFQGRAPVVRLLAPAQVARGARIHPDALGRGREDHGPVTRSAERFRLRRVEPAGLTSVIERWHRGLTCTRLPRVPILE